LTRLRESIKVARRRNFHQTAGDFLRARRVKTVTETLAAMFIDKPSHVA
jgi:hypothetical protein